MHNFVCAQLRICSTLHARDFECAQLRMCTTLNVHNVETVPDFNTSISTDGLYSIVHMVADQIEHLCIFHSYEIIVVSLFDIRTANRSGLAKGLRHCLAICTLHRGMRGLLCE
eukprot:4977823-Pleurochrysis_carterae.AAC.1